MRKQFVIIGIIFLLIGFSNLSISSNAQDSEYSSTFEDTISSVISGQIVSGVTVYTEYSLDAKMTIQNGGGTPGSTSNCELSLTNGHIYLDLTVNIPFLINEEFDIDFNAKLGSTVTIPIPGTATLLKGNLKVTATAYDIEDGGNININTNTLSYSSEGKKSISYSIPSNAVIDDSFFITTKIKINMEMELEMIGGISIYDGSLDVGYMTTDPLVYGSVMSEIPDDNGGFSFDLSNPIFLLLIIIIIVVVVIVIVAVAYKKKKSKKKPVPVQKKVEKPITKTKPDPKLKEYKAIEAEEKTFEEEVEEIKKSKKKPVEKTKKKEPVKEEEKPVEKKKKRNFCPKCGKILTGNPAFCGKCGHKF